MTTLRSNAVKQESPDHTSILTPTRSLQLHHDFTIKELHKTLTVVVRCTRNLYLPIEDAADGLQGSNCNRSPINDQLWS